MTGPVQGSTFSVADTPCGREAGTVTHTHSLAHFVPLLDMRVHNVSIVCIQYSDTHSNCTKMLP